MLVLPITTLIPPFPHLWFIPRTFRMSGTIPKCSSFTSRSEPHTSVGSNVPQRVRKSEEVFYWLISRGSTAGLWADPPPVMVLVKLRQVPLMRLFRFPCLPLCLCAPLHGDKLVITTKQTRWADKIFSCPHKVFQRRCSLSHFLVGEMTYIFHKQVNPMSCPTGWICR